MRACVCLCVCVCANAFYVIHFAPFISFHRRLGIPNIPNIPNKNENQLLLPFLRCMGVAFIFAGGDIQGLGIETLVTCLEQIGSMCEVTASCDMRTSSNLDWISRNLNIPQCRPYALQAPAICSLDILCTSPVLWFISINHHPPPYTTINHHQPPSTAAPLGV